MHPRWIGINLGLLLLVGLPLALRAQQTAQPQIVSEVAHAVSPPLREVVPELPNSSQQIPRPLPPIGSGPNAFASPNDIALQSHVTGTTASKTTIGLNFDGISNAAIPPDTNLSIGETQIVQIVNFEFAVFSKATGSDLYGPAAIHTIFSALGPPCGEGDGGDPIVLYDKMAGRWLISQMQQTTPAFLCVAVSQSSDATGAYNLYSFNFGSTLPDYEKFAVWPDAYYASFNMERTPPQNLTISSLVRVPRRRSDLCGFPSCGV